MVHHEDQLRKASVSITHVKNHAALGHTGINILAGARAPNFAFSTAMNNDQVAQFAEEVIHCFQNLNQDIFIATAKVLA